MSAVVAEGEKWTPERRAALAARLAALPCADQVDVLKDLVVYCDQQLADARAERDRLRAALEAARTAMHSTESGWEDDPRGAIYRARLDVELALAPGDPIVEAAIARAEALKAEADA